ncbi:MAG TPA: methionine synthase [Nocardioidaceae bacterium]|nr:methionine synthase [Nocardioidaceae bacterium]
MTLASGIGSMPGEDARGYDEALRIVLGELSLPHLPELPGRGAHADMVGRALAIVAELGADLQPAGWRLTGTGSGIDQRRATSLLSQDLDALEEKTQTFEGPLKIQVAGPWTLAATVERPRGDRVLADHGARRELAEALAEGLSTHIADVRRRIPGASLLVQVDEPALPAVLAGAVPTASGFHRHRSVDAPGAAPGLEVVFEAIASAGATPVAHCCAADVPVDLLTSTGAQGLSVDLSVLSAGAYDGLAAALEAGQWALLGVVPTSPVSLTDKQVTERVARFLDMVGLEPTERLVLTPACGLAGADPAWARRALELAKGAAKNLGS